MSDGLSDSRRAEQIVRLFAASMFDLNEALAEVDDAAFGLPRWAIDDLNAVLAKYGLRVVRKEET